MPIIENQDPIEAKLDPDRGLAMPTSQDFLDKPEDDQDAEKPQFNDVEVLGFLGEARRLSRTYQQMVAMGEWERSHAAYRSEHSSGSKYTKDQYKNRAKYFKPKTRAAVRKNLTATANAMFASQDVMSCEAQDDGNVAQRANAALIKEIINARFNSKAKKTGVPWFLTALGARLDTQVMGVVCSKQTWRYRAIEKTRATTREEPIVVNGVPLIDPATQQPMMEVVDDTETFTDVLEDKPVITLIPAEMVLVDPSASWIDPAQSSPTLIVQWPMQVDDVKAMMAEDKNPTPWRQIGDEELRGAFFSETEVMGIRAAREGKTPPTQRKTSTFGGNRGDVVDVWECFFRRDGVDYHCWTLKNRALLSDPAPVDEVYPAHRGGRPYVLGTDVLEPHVLYPESHVASWRQSQDEINDFSNLRMDATRQAVFPTAKVKAGKNIDYKAVQRRDGQGIILVREMGDVEWDRPPGVPAGAYQEVNLLSNDFDELAGIFSQNSVQSNRGIGDTVGGMQLIASSANATSEFDLRCFIETWAEPVLSQIVMLEQYYEDDETLLAVSGQKAKLFEKFGVDHVTDELLESQVTITMNIGIGASDPMQQLAKFKTVFELATPMLSMALKEGRAKIKYDEIFAEIFGKAGYRNGAERFIELKDEEQQQIPPEKVQELMQALQQMQEQNKQLQQALKDKGQEQQASHAARMQEIAVDAMSRQQETAAKSKSGLVDSLIKALAQINVAQISAETDRNSEVIEARIQEQLGMMTAPTTAPMPRSMI